METKCDGPIGLTAELVKSVLEKHLDCDIQLYGMEIEPILNISKSYRVCVKLVREKEIGFR